MYDKIPSRPDKPTKPRPPTKTVNAPIVFPMRSDYRVCSAWDDEFEFECSLKSILEAIEELRKSQSEYYGEEIDLKDVEGEFRLVVKEEWGRYTDDGSSEYNLMPEVYYYQEATNDEYKKKLERYELEKEEYRKRMQKYEEDLKDYSEKLDQYIKSRTERAEKQEQINNLKKQLKELEKQNA